MHQNAYSDVRVVLCETNPSLRSGLQSALHGKGFRHLTVCKDAAGLEATLAADLVDLMVCDVELPGLDFCSMAQRVRHNACGRNPFVLIISILSDSSVGQVRRMVNAGVDRVLRKPTSMNTIGEHVDALMQSRKPFVATEHYIGPTRRSVPRPDDCQDDLIEVPNSFRSKVVERTSAARLQAMIQDGWSRVVELRALTSESGLGRVIGRVRAYYEGEGTLDGLLADLDRLTVLGEDLCDRHRGKADHIADLAASLISVTMRIAQRPVDAARVHLELLGQLGEAVRLALTAKGGAAGVAQQIAETIGRFSAAPGPRRLH